MAKVIKDSGRMEGPKGTFGQVLPKAKSVHHTMASLAGKLEKRAEAISKIKTKTDLEAVQTVLSNIKTAQKQVKEEKAKEVDPIQEGLDAIKKRWKTWETQLASVENQLKGMILDYNMIQAQKAQKLQQDFESGKIKKFETLETKLEDTKVAGNGISLRNKKVYEVVNEALIPREYMMPNMALIKIAIEDGATVPGVVVKIEKIVSAK